MSHFSSWGQPRFSTKILTSVDKMLKSLKTLYAWFYSNRINYTPPQSPHVDPKQLCTTVVNMGGESVWVSKQQKIKIPSPFWNQQSVVHWHKACLMRFSTHITSELSELSFYFMYLAEGEMPQEETSLLHLVHGRWPDLYTFKCCTAITLPTVFSHALNPPPSPHKLSVRLWGDRHAQQQADVTAVFPGG